MTEVITVFVNVSLKNILLLRFFHSVGVSKPNYKIAVSDA
jgi:hypothetical protein